MKREEILKQTIESFDEGDRYVVDKNDVKYIRQDIVLKAMELSEQSLPPAEGAEFDMAKMAGALLDEAVELRKKVDELQSQPTAEGAEEITAKEYLQNKYPQMRGHLWNSNEHINDDWIAEMMEGFATLHAQKLADKTVGEKILNFIHWLRYRNFTDDTMTDEGWLSLYRNNPDIPE